MVPDGFKITFDYISLAKFEPCRDHTTWSNERLMFREVGGFNECVGL